MILWSPDLSDGNINGSCTMDYCGHEGVLLNPREWFGFKSQVAIERNKQWMHYRPRCTNGLMFKNYMTENGRMYNPVDDALFSVQKDRCALSLNKMVTNLTMSRLELQAFSPITAGLNKIYRYNRGTIEVGLVEYRQVKQYQYGPNPPTINVSFINGQNISWTSFITNSGILDGPKRMIYLQG